jgi:hypothetical protein
VGVVGVAGAASHSCDICHVSRCSVRSGCVRGFRIVFGPKLQHFNFSMTYRCPYGSKMYGISAFLHVPVEFT